MKALRHICLLIAVLTLLLGCAAAQAESRSFGITINYGEPAQFSVEDYYSGDGYTYQWNWYDENDEWTLLEDVTGPVFDLDSCTRPLSICCDVLDGEGVAIDSFDWYVDIENHLTAKAVGGRYPFVAPGEDVRMEVEASCDEGTLFYKWTDPDGNVLEGATESVLVAENIKKKGSYNCCVSDIFENTTEVTWRVSIDNQLDIRTVGNGTIYLLPGDDARMEVVASCLQGNLRYEWQDGQHNVIGGATDPVFVVPNVDHNQTYFCYVYDDYDNSRSDSFHIAIDTGLGVDRSDFELLVPYGETTTLSVSAYSSNATLTYEWKDSDGDTIVDATTSEYITPPILEYANYTCYVRDEYGNSQRVDFWVDVDSGLTAAADGPDFFNLQPGESVDLKVNASVNVGDVHYRWGGWSAPETTYTYNTGAVESSGWFNCRVLDDFDRYIYVDFFCAVNAQTLTDSNPIAMSTEEGDFFYFLVVPETTGDYYFVTTGGEYDDFELYGPDYQSIETENLLYTGQKGIRAVHLEAGQRYILEINLFEDNAEYTLSLDKSIEPIEPAEDDLEEIEEGVTWYLRKGQTVVIPENLDGYDFKAFREMGDAGLLSANRDRMTALSEGTTKVRVTFHDRDAAYIYRVIVMDAPVVSLPDSLNTLSSEALAGTDSAAFVAMGQDVSCVGQNAFNGSGLKQLLVSGSKTTFAGGALRGTGEITMIVPKDSRALRYADDHGIHYLLLP